MHSRSSSNAKQSRTHRRRRSTQSPLAIRSLQVVDYCLVGILFVAPLFFGGRHLLGRFVFIALACLAGVSWFVHQTAVKQGYWTRNWANVLGLAALLLVALQLAPLPAEWLQLLAPRNTSLLSLWQDGGDGTSQLGSWQTLTLTPTSTRIALATLLAYVLLFITAAGRMQTRGDIERLLRLVALVAMLMAGFGILQYLTSNGKFFWFYDYPYTTTAKAAKGSFTTRNHFAHFLVLGMGPLLAWIVLLLRRKTKPTKQSTATQPLKAHYLVAALHIGLGIVALAVMLSLSRGGIVAMLVAAVVTVAIYSRRRLLSGSYLYGLAMLGLFVVGLLSLSDYDRVANRLDDFASGSLAELDNNDGRRKIWAANMAAIQTGSLFGSGAGSHREIYPIFLPQSPINEYTHAENGYLQIATENGWLGVGLIAAAVALVSRWCWIAVRKANDTSAFVLAGAITASLAVSFVHSVVDFVWFIPACMSLTILLAAAALRLAQLAETAEVPTSVIAQPWPRARWIGLATAATCAAVWAITTMLGPALASTHWDKFLLVASRTEPSRDQESTEEDSMRNATAEREARARAMIFHLQNVLTRDPQFARAHLRLAAKYLQLFNQRQQDATNAMSIDQIRDAAIASRFPSSQDLRQWLMQAFGENSRLLYQAHYHTRQALLLCPLQGEGYLYLANLCFLEGRDSTAAEAYMAQALQVRPYDGDVLFETGRQRLLLGQLEQAFAEWQRIFHDRGNHQRKIIRLLAGHLPAMAFLELFEPNWSTLPLLWDQYRQKGSPQDWQALVDYTADQAATLQSPEVTYQAAHVRYALAEMHRELEHPEHALHYYQQAQRLAPNVFVFRRALGRALLRAQQYEAAQPHLRWCLARRPDNETIRDELIEAKKSRLPQTALAAPGTVYQ